MEGCCIEGWDMYRGKSAVWKERCRMEEICIEEIVLYGGKGAA